MGFANYTCIVRARFSYLTVGVALIVGVAKKQRGVFARGPFEGVEGIIELAQLHFSSSSVKILQM